jgi:hypothetical protein
MRGCRVSPLITERFEASASTSNVGKYVEQVSCRSCEPVKPCHNQRIAICQGGDSLCQLRPIALCAANFFFEYFGDAFRDKLGNLSVKRLSIRADSRVTNYRHFLCSIMQI